MWFLTNYSYFGARHAFFVQISKGGIEFFKKRFKVVEQGWMMLPQMCKPNKDHAWQQGANESKLN